VHSNREANGDNWRLSKGDMPGEIILSGEIDFSVTPTVRARLQGLMAEGAPEIVLDMAGLSYIDSSGLAMLIELRKVLAESGRTVTIKAISPQVRKLFNLTQLGEFFGLPD
jgi:anti-sigma B factor antagonist